MSEYSETAEQTVKMTLEGMDYILRIVGDISKEAIAEVHAIMESKTQTKGKTTLANMVKSGKPVSIFQLQKKKLREFAKEANNYGVVYVVIKDKADKNGNVDIMVSDENKAKIDRIFKKLERNEPNKTEVEKQKEEMAEKYLNGDVEKINPNTALIKGNQSENSSKNQLKENKPSVRAELKKYANEIEKNNKAKETARNSKSKVKTSKVKNNLRRGG